MAPTTSDAATEPRTLPTDEELGAALDKLHIATSAVMEVRFRVNRIASLIDEESRPPFERPTFQDIGALYMWARRVLPRLEEMRGYVDEMLDDLDMLDEIREELDPEFAKRALGG